VAKYDRIVVSSGYICLVSKGGERFHIGRDYYGHLRYALSLSDLKNSNGDDTIEVVTLKITK